MIALRFYASSSGPATRRIQQEGTVVEVCIALAFVWLIVFTAKKK